MNRKNLIKIKPDIILHRQAFFAILSLVAMSVRPVYSSMDFDADKAITKLQSPNVKDRGEGANELSGLVVTHHLAELKKDSSIIDALIVMADKENDPGVRDHIITTLTAIHDEKAYPVLLKIVHEAKEPSSRRMAIRGLAALNGTESISVLKEALAQDPHVTVRFVAAEELGKLGDDSGFDFSMEKIKSNDEFVRRDAAIALGSIGKIEAIPELKKLANEEGVGSGAANKALLEISLRQLHSDQEKLNFLKRSLYGNGPAPGWAARKLAAMRSRAALQLLLDTARSNAKPDTHEYYAKESATKMFEGLYHDGTPEGYQKIEEMKRTGVLQQLPN